MLPDLQRRFLDHVFGMDDDIASLVSEEGLFTPLQRLQVYKNNTRLALTEVLLQTFPAVTKLVDEKFMRYAAQEFMTRHPPASGDMNDYGAAFPDFLAAFPALAGHPYVADVARLEWLRQESFLSPCLPPGPGGALQPHVRLLHSAWPAARLWAFALEGGAAPAPGPAESFVLIHRADRKVAVRGIDRAAYSFLAGGEEPASAEFIALCLRENLFTAEAGNEG